MALKYTHRPGGTAFCPQCKEPISRQANICPHCQSDLTKDEDWQAQKANSSAGCASLILFAFVCTGIIGLSLQNLIG